MAGSALFVCFLVVPMLAWFVLGLRGSSSEEDPVKDLIARVQESSKREILSTFDAWFLENSPFRSDAISLKNTIDAALLGESGVSNVLVGEEGWLFYWEKGESVAADYKGVSSFSDEEMSQYLSEFQAVKDNLEGQGIEFCVIVCPNKERVYREYVPSRIPVVDENSRTTKLVEYVRGAGFNNICFPEKELQEAKGTLPTYLMADSHWGGYGASVGYSAVAKLMGWADDSSSFDVISYWTDSRKVERGEYASSHPNARSTGDDLAVLLNINAYEANKTVVGEGLAYSWRVEGKVDTFASSAADNERSKSVLLIGDSFREELAPFLTKEFQTVSVMHSDDYLKQGVELSQKPEVVVFQFVERYAPAQHSYLKALSEERF